MTDPPTLRDVGEHPFLARLCARIRARESARPHSARLLVPPGDDCAVLAAGARPLVLTTDALVEGVHFRRGWLDARQLGCRAIAVNLSDLAAMGAEPVWTLVAIAAPADLPAQVLDEILDGCQDSSAAAGAMLVGGNLTTAPVLSITVTAGGELSGPCLTRAGARAGDHLVVTGTLGGAAAAVAAWLAEATPRSELAERFVAPVARIAAGKALAAAGAHAAIDVSDGLLADLGHLCAASGVGAIVERARLPRLPAVARLDATEHDFAACGGEDYELVVACPDDLVARLDELTRTTDTPLTVIGRCTDAAGVVLHDESGRPHAVRQRGFDHFARTP
ncbi:thiamine-phosphate kinase [Candidatus Binatia bacterium]|nr:thiamine-phosphate kinase [Candidatus Binatia bacterium]